MKEGIKHQGKRHQYIELQEGHRNGKHKEEGLGRVGMGFLDLVFDVEPDFEGERADSDV